MCPTRKVQLQKLFYRIAQDSQFTMEPVQVAQLGARVLQCSPLEFWIALGYDYMVRIAKGEFTEPKWPEETV